jgi:hypothetical protein
MCPFYKAWISMISRCYSKNSIKKYPTYADCSVVSEWHTLSKFSEWMAIQDWRGKDLDKDLLVSGNKVYGPDTCVFVSSYINTMITGTTKSRNDLPIGVSVFCRPYKDGGVRYKATASFRSKATHIGYYRTPEEARKAYKIKKAEYMFSVADFSEENKSESILAIQAIRRIADQLLVSET